MGALGPKLRRGTDGAIMFHCPGCEGAHAINIGSGSGPRWTWNGDEARPTFSPSVLVRSGHYAQGHAGECWCSYEARFGRPAPFICSVCHSFVLDGRIQFLGDCTHALAGRTVDLPDWDADGGKSTTP